MKKIICFLIMTVSAQLTFAGTINSLNASHVGDSILFDWSVQANNGIVYYDVMEKINASYLEKVCAHVEVSDPAQTSYHAGGLLAKAQTLGYLSLLAIGLMRRKWMIAVALILCISCRKTQDTSKVDTGNPYPDVSSQTQGVFRIRFVDVNGNIGNSDYITVKY